jgi:hypothetical protein
MSGEGSLCCAAPRRVIGNRLNIERLESLPYKYCLTTVIWPPRMHFHFVIHKQTTQPIVASEFGFRPDHSENLNSATLPMSTVPTLALF